MKTQAFFISTWIVLILSMFLSCSNSEEIEVPELSYQEKEIMFLESFKDKVRGDWKVEKMVIAKNLYDKEPNDTIIYDLGRIYINSINNDPAQPEKYNRLEAYFDLGNEPIPFKSRLLVYISENANRGQLEFDSVTGLIESAYQLPYSPINTNLLPKEYQFLNHYFFGDNYIMVLSDDEKTWIWKGLNRYVQELVLTR